MIVDFIREHAGRREVDGLRWGVEPICQVLRDHGIEIAPSTYYEWRDKLPSNREQHDEALLAEIRRAQGANFGVGLLKVGLTPRPHVSWEGIVLKGWQSCR